MANTNLNTLQMRRSGSGVWANEGHRSGSVSDLKDFATAQNTDYRIIDPAGKTVWEFQFSHRGGKR